MIFDIPKFYSFAKKYDFKSNKEDINPIFLELGGFPKIIAMIIYYQWRQPFGLNQLQK